MTQLLIQNLTAHGTGLVVLTVGGLAGGVTQLLIQNLSAHGTGLGVLTVGGLAGNVIAFIRLFSTRNRYLGISGCGNDTRLPSFKILFARTVGAVVRSPSTVAPEVVDARLVNGDLQISVAVSGKGTLGFTVNRAVIDLEIRGPLHPGITVHQVAEGVHQLDGKGLACLNLIIMDVISVLVGKQVEAAQHIPAKRPTFKACNINEVTVLQDDTVGGGADGIPAAIL